MPFCELRRSPTRHFKVKRKSVGSFLLRGGGKTPATCPRRRKRTRRRVAVSVAKVLARREEEKKKSLTFLLSLAKKKERPDLSEGGGEKRDNRIARFEQQGESRGNPVSEEHPSLSKKKGWC